MTRRKLFAGLLAAPVAVAVGIDSARDDEEFDAAVRRGLLTQQTRVWLEFDDGARQLLTVIDHRPASRLVVSTRDRRHARLARVDYR